ncbi:hypothetical protein [Kitasatospora viridis]|uniref:Uncharacterized protein n=1 Tax=Kitasatospora viridis TaxID=281105 RepID=A0A561TW16_9ACTN|nr:hypothetical protein [Kitasatospora viridis]TWF91301.1 hypothetical protein FHX73_12413 [Kitasatospora viridis]
MLVAAVPIVLTAAERFTTSDLDDLPARLDRHTFADQHPGSSAARVT